MQVRSGLLGDLAQDIGFALRRARRHPSFALAVIGILSLGIGGATAMFGAFDAAALASLPFPHAAELVSLPLVNVARQHPGTVTSGSRFVTLADIHANTTTFTHAAAWVTGGMNLSDPRQPERVQVTLVTADYFQTFGVQAGAGRTFQPSDQSGATSDIAVVSRHFWVKHFGKDPLLEQILVLNGHTYAVVGIAPVSFTFPEETDVWLPMILPVSDATTHLFSDGFAPQVVARLAPGVALDAANRRLLEAWRRDLGADAATVGGRYHEILTELLRVGGVRSLQRALAGNEPRALIAFFGATVRLLLIACANISNMLLAQTLDRRGEIALRESLGASPRRVVRQLLVECVVVGVLGGICGAVLALLIHPFLRGMEPPAIVSMERPAVYGHVLLFGVILAGMISLAFGLWPALTIGRADHAGLVRSGITRVNAGKGGRVARRALLAVELTSTFTLLVAAGLLLRSFQRITTAHSGIDVAHVGTMQLVFAGSTNVTLSQRLDAILDRIRETPGVSAAGAVSNLPLAGDPTGSMPIIVDGPTSAAGSSTPMVEAITASGDYFQAVGATLIGGRTFRRTDDSTGPPVAIINKRAADMYWPGTNPIGRSFRYYPGDPNTKTIVGIVSDIQQDSVNGPPTPQIYLSIGAQPLTDVAIVARSSGTPAALLKIMTQSVHAIDPLQPVFRVRMMGDVLGESIASRRLNMVLVSMFAVLALAIAAFGIYAVVAQNVTGRLREFGVRSALGATSGGIMRLVAAEVVQVTLVSICLGFVICWLLARVMHGAVYGVTEHDTATFVAALLIVCAAAFVAVWIPSRRATQMEVADLLRTE